MKNRKLLCVLGFVCLGALQIFAHGKKDVEEIKVDNLQSWQTKVDLESRTKKKAQKYNIMITATDLGGNTTVEGPFNIYVDPESDRPIVGITNPYVDMRVVGNLNIVGTCVDDDGVSKVMLILDEGKVNQAGESIEKTVQAKGQEFWSYYLDTNDLEEGPHTIKVIGYDINGLESYPYVLRWQLDRKQPVTEVQNLGMGQLVCGNVSFKGQVGDGNGIKELYYSTDNGEFFSPVSVSSSKDNKSKTKNALCNFSFSVDTKKFPDGPSVVWFKAIDEAGSVGYYSFLYFIDNTKPDVQIIYPEDGMVVNGKFSAAGFAKDSMGITSLSWEFGDQKGDFELVPGNPYWNLDIDVVNAKSKSGKLVIKATDNAGNVVETSKNISIDPDSDKPIATIADPQPGKLYAGDEPVYVRGFVKDDDRVGKVVVQLDGNTPVEYETNGAYSYTFCKATELSAGSHKITVTPYDENGVAGNPVSVTVESKGVAPTFSGAVMSGTAFVNGMEIHPETNGVFEVNVAAQLGLTSVETKLTGAGIAEEKKVELKNAGSYKVSIPVTATGGRGMMNIDIKATDSLGRVSMYRAFFHVTETSKIKSDTLQLVLDDSVFVESDGILRVQNNPEIPVSGYVLGGNATAVEISPSTPFARAKLVGNSVVIEAGRAVGSSEPVKIRVRTDRNGRVVESKPIIFVNDTALPVFSSIRANNTRVEGKAVDGTSGNVRITGNVSCETGLLKVKYRLLRVAAALDPKTNVVTKITPSMDAEYKDASLAGGSFGINLDTQDLGTGYFVVEILAESRAGNKTSAAVVVSTIPEIVKNEEGTRIAAPKLFNTWFESEDLFGVAVYQGEIDKHVEIFPRSSMKVGANAFNMTVNAESGASTFKSPTVSKQPDIQARFSNFDDGAYYSGMAVTLPKDSNKSEKHFLKMFISTFASVGSVSYEIYGDAVPGGDVKQAGSAKVSKDGDGRYYAEIPIGNLPARVNHIKAVVKASGLKDTVVTGTILVVRPKTELSDDAERVYNYMDSFSAYDSQDGNYVMPSGSQVFYYVNIPTTFKAELSTPTPGLAVEVKGNVVILTAEKDGNYRGVRVRITDPYGRVVESRAINILADSEGPNLVIQSQDGRSWVRNTLSIKGTAQDALGVRSVEYSIDNGENWRKFSIEGGRGVTFGRDIDVSGMEDGLVQVDIRAVDNAGHVAYANLAVFKDTTAPEVRVIAPLAGDIVNGDNLIVFEVEDIGAVGKAYYSYGGTRNELPIGPLVTTHVGTKSQPIDARMSFTFVDEAGNSKSINSWDFKVDNKSDLPVAEIHIPNEEEVLTRNFTISGVVYDDDGDSKVFYRIDNGQYRQVAKDEVYGQNNPEAEYPLTSNYEIFVPIEEMTDNEHTVTVYAVDQNGVRGEEVRRKFRISLEEPKGSVEKPTIDTSVRDVIEISGVASDKNGIKKVEVSLDNGNSYNDATGKERWSYKVDTRAIPGGTQVVFLRVTDNYGITGLYSSLINIDNNAPNIILEYPLDDSTSTGTLFFSGYAYDNVEITKMYVTIRSMDRSGSTVVRNLKIDRIIGETLDISSLPNGFYNVELTGEDKAGNKTNVSRNIHIDKNKPTATVDILYPLNGEHKNGYFNIYGQTEVQPDTEVETLRLYVDNKVVKETNLTDSGFFKFEITPPTTEDSGEVDENGESIKRNRVDMTDGTHTYKVEAVLKNGRRVTSREQTITYSQSGPWITLDNFVYGDFATDRPYLKGKAGCILSDAEKEKLDSKETNKEQKAALNAKKTIQCIEISLDNGKTFTQLSTKNKWEYRIENQDLSEGYHFILVRVTMMSGDKAIERTIVQIDNTSPKIKLIAPGKGGRYNQVLDVSGLSSDDVKLEDVTVVLRKGDKSAYEVPSFIQGLYLDFHFWGATLYEIGAGLTFFDDNVKVQFQWGQFTQSQRDMANSILGKDPTVMRYGGDNVFGFKLLANISQIPFSYFWGHDWEWLYANFAVGAQFSRFNETGSGKPQWLSAIELQMEFPRIVRKNASMFSAFSFYTEASLWFIPSDVAGESINSMVFQFAFGLRTNIF